MSTTTTPAPIDLDNGVTLTHNAFGRYVLTGGKVVIGTLRIVAETPGQPRRITLTNRRGMAITTPDGHWQLPATAVTGFTAR